MYTLNDFFCGCGGIGIGFQDAGFNIVKAWDFDKYAVQSYKENVGDHVEQTDIKNMTIDDVPKATAWAFGFPCQDLSVAGNQAGMEMECNSCGTTWKLDTDNQKCPNCQSIDFKAGNRSGLFFEIMRLLDEAIERESQKLPLVLLAENVKALRSYLPILEAEYAKRGYKAYYTLLNSKYWDVPQNRERYFVVGIREDISAEFTFPTEQHDHVPKLSSILESNVDEKYYINDDKARTIIDQALKKLESLGYCHATITPDRIEKRQNGRRAKGDEEEMFTLTAQDLHGVILETSPNTGGDDLPRIMQIAHKGSGGQKGWIHHTDGIVGCCTATDYKDPKYILEEQREPKIDVVGMLDIKSHDHSRRVHDPDGLCPTVTAVSGGTHHIKVFDYSRYRVRKLTPTEYGRLQGFPMDRWNQVVSNSQAYKQFGNAVTTTVAKAIATTIAEFLDNNLPLIEP